VILITIARSNQISDFRFQISDFKFQISDFRFQISDFRFQISDFRFQISDFRFLNDYSVLFLLFFQVSWIRYRDTSLLTVGRYTYTTDLRFEAFHSPHTDDWIVRLKAPRPTDSGVYGCQISTTPHRTQKVYLTVHGKCSFHFASKKSINTMLDKYMLSCSSALPSARQKSVFAYPKQSAMVLCPVHLFVISSTAEVSSRIQNRELRY
jgi:hypothetical protein